MKILIKATNTELSPSIEEYIYKKIGKINKLLKKVNPELVKARVEVERMIKHHKKGDIFRAEINLGLPGQLLRSEAKGLTLTAAIDKVKDYIAREVKKYRNKQKAKYKRKSRRTKILLRLSPLTWFKKNK